MSAQKMFLRILIIDSMNPIMLPFVFFQISKFGEDEIFSMLYACGLHVLCIVSMLIIHLHSGKHDVGRDNHSFARWNIHLAKRFLSGNKIEFYSPNH